MRNRLFVIAAGAGVVMMAGSVQAAGDAVVPEPPVRKDRIRVLIVTGGHDFEREPFFAMFDGHPDITWREVTQPDAAQWMSPERADEYDVLVWYDFWLKIAPQAREHLQALLAEGKPVVALHHSICNYLNWPEAFKILGARFYPASDYGVPKATFTYDVTLPVLVADPFHPITRFQNDFVLHDEAYKGMTFASGLHPLLITTSPQNDRLIGWTHTYGASPIVYLQGGHGPSAFGNPGYRRVLVQAIRWAAGRLPDPSNDGFVRLFNGVSLDGWTVTGDPAGFVVDKGILRSESGKHGQWIRTNRTYGNFVLRLDWRICQDGNSGVFIRAADTGEPWNTGAEIQLSNDPRDDIHCTGSLYGRVAVDPRPDETAEVWHHLEIRCVGPRITIFADNLPVIDVDQRDVPAMKDVPLNGYIGLQDAHRPGWVEYRNILIKELPE